MNKSTPPAIRLTRTPEVIRALALAKKRYPTLSDPEILKVGLARLTADETEDLAELRAMNAMAFGEDYLNNPEEDIYHKKSSNQP